MELIVKGQFYRDITRYSNFLLLENIYEVMKSVEEATDISQIQNLKKLKKYKVYYRIKVAEIYRIGVVIRVDTVWFVRFGHRSKFYKKKFP